jgi:hypothetical protein
VTRFARPTALIALLLGAGLLLPTGLAVAATPTIQSDLDAVACPSATVCVAVGGIAHEVIQKGAVKSGSWTPYAVWSSDAGVHWTRMSVPSVPNLFLTSVACAAVTQCSAVGAIDAIQTGQWAQVGSAALFLSAANKWSSASMPTGTRPLNSVSCPAVSRCVAVGGNRTGNTLTMLPSVLHSTTGGRTWSQASSSGLGKGLLYGLACPTTARCMAVGVNTGGGQNGGYNSRPVAIRTTDGGTRWSSSLISSSAGGGPLALGCTPTSTCVGVGDQFVSCGCGTGEPGTYAHAWVTSNVGKKYADHLLPQEGSFFVWYLWAISCWSTGCETTGEASHAKPGSPMVPITIELSSKNGWTGSGPRGNVPTVLRSQWIYGLHCWSAAKCVGVGQDYKNKAAIETSAKNVWTSRTP